MHALTSAIDENDTGPVLGITLIQSQRQKEAMYRCANQQPWLSSQQVTTASYVSVPSWAPLQRAFK